MLKRVLTMGLELTRFLVGAGSATTIVAEIVALMVSATVDGKSQMSTAAKQERKYAVARINTRMCSQWKRPPKV